MLSYEQAVSYALSGDAIFIVGSGFSIFSKNEIGESLLSGRQLAKKLSEAVEMDDDVPLDIIAQEYIDQIGERHLCDFLKKHYTVSSFEAFYDAFAKIKELKVYTTNYDDLIEKICKKNNKKIKSYTLSERINKCNKKNMIMHLNGYVDALDEQLSDNFLLTYLSYDRSHFYNSPWFPYIKDEMRCAKAIFIIGLSFKSDLDLRRLIGSDPELTDKCFIIESPDLSENDKSYLSKYGHVIQNGIQEFCADLNSFEPYVSEKKVATYNFKSFKEIKKTKVYNGLTDEEMFKLFFFGEIEKNAFYQNEKGAFDCLVNRSKLDIAIQAIKSGKSLIIHSDLGNGKSIFLEQLLHKLYDYKTFKLLSIQNEKLPKEIELLCSSKEKIIIIIEPYNLFLSDFEKFQNYDLSNVQFILLARTAMHDNCCNIIYDIIDRMNGVDFSTNPINLNTLDNDEISEVTSILDRYGFWGEQSTLSLQSKVDILSKTLGGKFQSILLYLFEEGQIKAKFENILQNVSSDKLVMQILILSFINEILELTFNYDDFNTIFDRDNIDKILRRRRNDLGEFIDFTSNKLRVKSSIISKALIGCDSVPKAMVKETLLMVANRLDSLYDGNKKYGDALKNIASASYLSFIFDYNLDSKLLIEYYEKIKENNFNKKNLFFWEQYAIACTNIKEFSRAKKYFETSYALAKKRGSGFSTFQIDNHYARFLLESQLYSRNYKSAFSTFLEAHRLLTKSYISNDLINDRYYQFKVAVKYKEYYVIFFDHFNVEEKGAFISRCQEMLNKLKAYIKGNYHQEQKMYIEECHKNLEYILSCSTKK